MKKYILSLLIVGLSFIGFSSAGFILGDYSCSSSYNCQPSNSVRFGSCMSWEDIEFVFEISNPNCDVSFIQCNDVNCSSQKNSFNGGFITPGIYTKDLLKDRLKSEAYDLPICGYIFVIDNNPSCSFPVNLSFKKYTPPLLSGGFDNLSPVVNGLKTSINEFIPYIVYIGLGILGVLIGFYAIKRLLRYVKGSTFSVFSSRRKK